MSDSDGQWPHDPDGEHGSEGMRKYGQAKKLDEQADFPLTVAEFVAEHGDDPIRLNHQRVVSVRDIFEHVEESEFETMVDLHKGVGRAMRRNDLWEYEGADAFVRTR
jgi:hypothetical protein